MKEGNEVWKMEGNQEKTNSQQEKRMKHSAKDLFLMISQKSHISQSTLSIFHAHLYLTWVQKKNVNTTGWFFCSFALKASFTWEKNTQISSHMISWIIRFFIDPLSRQQTNRHKTTDAVIIILLILPIIVTLKQTAVTVNTWSAQVNRYVIKLGSSQLTSDWDSNTWAHQSDHVQ